MLWRDGLGKHQFLFLKPVVKVKAHFQVNVELLNIGSKDGFGVLFSVNNVIQELVVGRLKGGRIVIINHCLVEGNGILLSIDLIID